MAGQEKIRVLIVDDIAETRENLRRLLQFDNSIEVIGAARTGREAIDVAQQAKPDVILMDINMPDMDGITATESIRQKVPFAQVIILSVQNDASYMRRAMLAGARDFLTKPPMIDELTAAIRRAGKMAGEERAKIAQALPAGSPSAGGIAPATPISSVQGKTIVVYSPKGGTGCTTIATNLAISLIAENSKVALVDGSLQFGDVAVFLNEQGKNNVLDLTQRVDDIEADVVESVMVTHNASGLQILAAPTRPEMADKVSGEQFAKLLKYMRQLYHYTIIDTASYLTDAVLSAMEVADLIILITTQEIPAIKNCNAFLGLADAVGIGRERILFIMNRYDKRIAITPERVGESLKQTVSTAIPFDERIVGNSVNRGVPFVVDNKAQPISKTIFALADSVRERVNASEDVRPPAKK